MTDIRLDVNIPTVTGNRLTDQLMTWTPTRRRIDSEGVKLPRPFNVNPSYTQVISVDPTGDGWAYAVTEPGDPTVRYFTVPDTDEELLYSQLARVDASQIDQGDTLWWAELDRQVVDGTVNDDGVLYFRRRNGEIVPAGYVKGEPGPRGLRGVQGPPPTDERVLAAATNYLSDHDAVADVVADRVMSIAADPALASVLSDPDSLSRQHVIGKGEIVLNVRDFGAVGDAVAGGAGTDDGAAIEAALAVAHNTSFIPENVARRIHFPGGLYRSNRDLFINASNVSLSGEGLRTGIVFYNAGLTLDGREGLLLHNHIRDMRLRRLGPDTGNALAILGGTSGSGRYPTRWALDHVQIESVGGTALYMTGTFLGTCVDIYLRNSQTGLIIEGSSLSANAVSFHGGEIQGVNSIGRISGALGISFHGMAWEGSASGMDVNSTRGLTVSAPYWENNGEFDLRVGETSLCRGISVVGGLASTGASPDIEHSIILRRSLGTHIAGVHFMNYAANPVLVNDAANGTVIGNVYDCTFFGGSSEAVVEIANGPSWGRQELGELTVGRGGTARIKFDGGNERTKGFVFNTGGNPRWLIQSGTSDDFEFLSYGDAGEYLGQALTIYRQSQQARFHANVRIDGDLHHRGSSVGFFNTTPREKPVVSGSRSDGTALTSLINALSQLGLITNDTTA